MSTLAPPSVEAVAPADPELAARLRAIAQQRAEADALWRDLICQAIDEGWPLRRVAAWAGVSHTAVKNIASGRQTG